MGKNIVICGLAIVAMLTGLVQAASNVPSALSMAADRLVAGQEADGSWAYEEAFTGCMVTALAKAYWYKNDASYKAAAEKAGNYIVNQYNSYCGDDLYAMTRLSEISEDRTANVWRSKVSAWYGHIASVGTQNTINQINNNLADSEAVLDLARNTVAAYYVDGADKELWRNNLISAVGALNDADAWPVGSLGLATWALAQTGPMDSRAIKANANAGSYWYQKTLADLPGLLAGHQVLSGTFAGSFYWQFDHTDAGNPDLWSAGYTEDTAWGTLGLMAVKANNISLPNLAGKIQMAGEALAFGIEGVTLDDPYVANGLAFNHIWDGGATSYLYAAETLEALSILMGDANVDGIIDVGDLGILAGNYGRNSGAKWCQGDFNGDGKVDVGDLGILAGNYGVGSSEATQIAVPEPLTIGLFGLGVLGMRGRRREE